MTQARVCKRNWCGEAVALLEVVWRLPDLPNLLCHPCLLKDNVPVQLCMRSAEVCTEYLQAIENTTRNGKRASLGYHTMTIFKESSVRFQNWGISLQRTRGTWNSLFLKN